MEKEKSIAQTKYKLPKPEDLEKYILLFLLFNWFGRLFWQF